MESVLVRASGLVKSFGGYRAVEDVSFELRRREIVGLIGANGAGKTTLIRLLIRLLRPDRGTVEWAERREAKTTFIGYLPEERGLYLLHAPSAVVEYLAMLKGLDRTAAERDARTWLERFELGGRSDRVEHLSKGQQQKAQLAATFVGTPSVLVLDEPYAGLDPLNARLTSEVVREAAATGCGLLLSAHHLSLVEQVCTRIVMLARGRVVFQGSIDEIRSAGGSLEELFVSRAAEGGLR